MYTYCISILRFSQVSQSSFSLQVQYDILYDDARACKCVTFWFLVFVAENDGLPTHFGGCNDCWSGDDGNVVWTADVVKSVRMNGKKQLSLFRVLEMRIEMGGAAIVDARVAGICARLGHAGLLRMRYSTWLLLNNF